MRKISRTTKLVVLFAILLSVVVAKDVLAYSSEDLTNLVPFTVYFVIPTVAFEYILTKG